MIKVPTVRAAPTIKWTHRCVDLPTIVEKYPSLGNTQFATSSISHNKGLGVPVTLGPKSSRRSPTGSKKRFFRQRRCCAYSPKCLERLYEKWLGKPRWWVFCNTEHQD